MAFRHLVAMKCLGDERECIIAFSLLSCLSWCVLKYYMSWGHVLPLCVCVRACAWVCVCVCVTSCFKGTRYVQQQGGSGPSSSRCLTKTLLIGCEMTLGRQSHVPAVTV